MIVTVSGLSGLTNAYRSVLSAAGSSLINGASRWLEAAALLGPTAPTSAAAATAEAVAAPSARSSTPLFMPISFLREEVGMVRRIVGSGSVRSDHGVGSVRRLDHDAHDQAR